MRTTLFLIPLVSALLLRAGSVEEIDIRPKNGDISLSKNKIVILDQKELRFDRIRGERFEEISGLAFDSAGGRLYMVNDEGRLFMFDAVLSDRIEKLTPVVACRLRDRNGKKLSKRMRDSEGIALNENGDIYVSFEGVPRIARIGKGCAVERYLRLPYPLGKRSSYRGRNKMLEALAHHSAYGLVFASEKPLAGSDPAIQSIYTLGRKKLNFRHADMDEASVTALEEMDNGDILVLERSYAGPLKPFVVDLRRVFAKECDKDLCRSEKLAEFSSDEGWLVQNFEGLARVSANRYLMISDNGKGRFQRTVLIYFEIESK